MLSKNDALQTLKTYNINSQKYEPTIYENNNNIGLCIDIKDSLFGYLTRIFLFNQKEELNDFLRGYFWYKNNKTYPIKLSLNDYTTKTPKIIYTYQDQELSLESMLNMPEYLQTEQNEKEEEQEKTIILKNISELTNYLIHFKQEKENIKRKKNELKTAENDLKYELLQVLTTYYGKEKNLTKKEITIDPPTPIDNTLLLENEKNIASQDLETMKQYLNSLINGIKAEELDEKNLINIYSNSVYEYNIDILKKQIEFVKSKINAEKNFNLKGSKIHNIDEELRSFLKTNVAPTKIEVFLKDNKERIEAKFNTIKNIKDSSAIITGNSVKLNLQEPQKIELKEQDDNQKLQTYFQELPTNIQTSFILYTSLFHPICNFIIENNYPEKEIIKNNFDFNHYFQELEEIVYNENNNHYLVKYFSQINFKDLDPFIESIINMTKEIINTPMIECQNLTLFTNKTTGILKHLTNYITKNQKYIVKCSGKLLLVPYKLEINWEQQEIDLIEDQNYYTKENIIEGNKEINITKYKKQQKKEDNIIVTTDLIPDEKIILKESHLEGGTHE